MGTILAPVLSKPCNGDWWVKGANVLLSTKVNTFLGARSLGPQVLIYFLLLKMVGLDLCVPYHPKFPLASQEGGGRPHIWIATPRLPLIQSLLFLFGRNPLVL